MSSLSSQGKKLGKIVLICIISILIIFLGINFLDNKENTLNKSDAKILERKANSNDIEIDISYKFPISSKIMVTPYVDIEDFELRLDFYNSSNVVVYTKYVEFGDIHSGRHYERSISLLDLNLSAITSDGIYYSVSRGTVHLL